jgi:transcriptional regulator with XRE-family HTH domain
MEKKHPLREVRERYNLSIDALAEETKLSRRTILRAEKGYAIYPSSRRILCEYFTKVEGRPITSQQLGLLVVVQEESPIEEIRKAPRKDAMETMEMNMKRRDFIIKTLQLSGAASMIPLMMNQENLERLVVFINNPSLVDIHALEYLEGVIDACWHLSNESKITEVERILPVYLPHIVTLAHQPWKHQQRAAHLASQSFILAAEIDRGNICAMLAYCQQAVLYSQVSENQSIQAAALKQQATISLVGKDPKTALLLYQKVLSLVDALSPLLRSRIYLGLASSSARCTQKQEALYYLGKAHAYFPDQPEQDPNYLYTVCSRPVMYLYDAITYTDLKQPKNAWDALMTIDGLNPKLPIPISMQIEFLNLQAKTATTLGNMELSISYLQASIHTSIQQGYKLWFAEARDIYQVLLSTWPNEPQVKALRDLFEKQTMH